MTLKDAATAALAVLALGGCADPEAECRAGVAQMKGELVGIIGAGQHKDAGDPYAQAHTELDMAQTRLATGQFEGCLENLEAARALLDRAQGGST